MEYNCTINNIANMASTRIQHRIDLSLKNTAEAILEEQGIRPAVAITIFYTEIARSGGFPFLPSKIPNKELTKDLKKARSGVGIKTYKNKKDFFKSLDEL